MLNVPYRMSQIKFLAVPETVYVWVFIVLCSSWNFIENRPYKELVCSSLDTPLTIILSTHTLSLSISLHIHTLSLSLSLFLYKHTLSLSLHSLHIQTLYISTHTHSLSLYINTFHLCFSLYAHTVTLYLFVSSIKQNILSLCQGHPILH